jgi:hypothetical protein
MGINKVIYGNQVLVDLTPSTVTIDTLLEGTVAFDASGNKIVGVLTAGNKPPTYTNQVPISIGTDKKVYNGIGWKEGYRLSASSGNESNVGNASVTGFIPVKANDIVRFKFTWQNNITWDLAEGEYSTGYNIMAYYNSSFGWLGSACPIQGAFYGICKTSDFSEGSLADGGFVSFKVPNNSNIKYLRLSFFMPQTNYMSLKNLVVTVNEEIV